MAELHAHLPRPDNETNIYFAFNAVVANCDGKVNQFFTGDPTFNGSDFGCGCK